MVTYDGDAKRVTLEIGEHVTIGLSNGTIYRILGSGAIELVRGKLPIPTPVDRGLGTCPECGRAVTRKLNGQLFVHNSLTTNRRCVYRGGGDS